jgi:hypothetical protein
VCDEVEQGWPVSVWERAPNQEIVECIDWGELETFGIFESGLEAPIDFGEQPRQIPRGEIITGRFAGGGALHEPPAVLLEVLPVPMGMEGSQQRRDLGRRPLDFGRHPDDVFFGPASLELRFECDPARDGFGCLAPCLGLDG